MHRRILQASAVAALSTLALCACSATSPNAAGSSRGALTPVPVATSTAGPEHPLAEGMVKSVLVSVYPATVFRAEHGCSCSLKNDSHEELFPAGSPIVLFKVTLTGIWGPAQGTSKTQDVSGTTIARAQFEGRPDLAQLASTDGPPAAHRLHLPWLPSGAFHDTTWTITNNKPVAFTVGWYVPAGVDTLDLSVNLPSEGEPTTLAVKLPDEVLKLTGAGDE